MYYLLLQKFSAYGNNYCGHRAVEVDDLGEAIAYAKEWVTMSDNSYSHGACVYDDNRELIMRAYAVVETFSLRGYNYSMRVSYDKVFNRVHVSRYDDKIYSSITPQCNPILTDAYGDAFTLLPQFGIDEDVAKVLDEDVDYAYMLKGKWAISDHYIKSDCIIVLKNRKYLIKVGK